MRGSTTGLSTTDTLGFASASRAALALSSRASSFDRVELKLARSNSSLPVMRLRPLAT